MGFYHDTLANRGDLLALEKEEVMKELPLNWIATEVFKIMDEREITDANMEKMVIETTGRRISRNSIRWWRKGKSVPRVDDTEAMARALGYEMDLVLREEG